MWSTGNGDPPTYQLERNDPLTLPCPGWRVMQLVSGAQESSPELQQMELELASQPELASWQLGPGAEAHSSKTKRIA